MLKALALIPELGFLTQYHITQAGIMAASAMAASAMGGMKEGVKVTDFMHPGSLPEGHEGAGGGGWRTHALNSAAADADFRRAVSLGLVGQAVFYAVTN